MVIYRKGQVVEAAKDLRSKSHPPVEAGTAGMVVAPGGLLTPLKVKFSTVGEAIEVKRRDIR